MLAAVDAANSLHFRFEFLTSLGGDESPLVLRAEKECSVDGLDADHPNRKLIVVVTLEGAGSVSFPSVRKERRLEAGTVAIFPAFLANSIVPEGELVAVISLRGRPELRVMADVRAAAAIADESDQAAPSPPRTNHSCGRRWARRARGD